MGSQIPLIDLQELEGLPEKLREASEKWGCFRIVNHGVPSNLMADMKQVGKDLHELPLEIKLRNKDVLPRSGYAPANERSPFHEALGLFDAGTSSSVSLFCSQLGASPQQRETVELYSQAMYKLLIDLANMLAKGMGLEDFCFDGWLCQSKINKYTFTAKSVGSFGFHPHTDVAFINILHEDENIGGLQVMDPNGAFVDVDHVPGSLVVLLGDIAVPWSNGRLCNVQHRVLCKNLGLRYTIVISISPPLGKAVEAPPEFVDANHPRLYSPFTYEDFRELRAAKRLTGDKALEVMRLQNYSLYNQSRRTHKYYLKCF